MIEPNRIHYPHIIGPLFCTYALMGITMAKSIFVLWVQVSADCELMDIIFYGFTPFV